jgi:pSer/pThr/pTyr-binding forkhead associated (FHA) protein
VGGQRYILAKSRTVVGRDESADIQVKDNGLSRAHFEMLWDGSKAGVRDLGSTNGTKINGRAISEVGIAADTMIQAGHSDFVFRLIAKTVRD